MLKTRGPPLPAAMNALIWDKFPLPSANPQLGETIAGCTIGSSLKSRGGGTRVGTGNL